MAAVSLESICTRISSGGTPSRKNSDYFSSIPEGHRWVKSKELLDCAIEETEERISEAGLKNSSAKFYPAHSVLVAMYGANVGQLGWLKVPATVNQAICGLVVDEQKADWRFVFYSLLLNRGDLTIQAQGAAQQNLNQDLIRKFCIEVPPLPIQRRIAGILSAYDALIENSQRRIKILESMARALYREWFVHFRFPGHESVPRVPSALGEIPEGWEEKPFSTVASYVNGYAFKPGDWSTDGKPIIKIKELKAGVTADTPRNSGDGIPEKYHIRDGDILFSWSADLDAYLWMGGEGLLNQHLFNVVPFDGLTRTFCCHALKEAMPRFRALSLGATMQHIKRSALDQVSTVVPPAAMRTHFDEVVEPIHKQLITLTRHVQNLRRTRDLLLPRLLSGQIDVAAMPA